MSLPKLLCSTYQLLSLTTILEFFSCFLMYDRGTNIFRSYKDLVQPGLGLDSRVVLNVYMFCKYLFLSSGVSSNQSQKIFQSSYHNTSSASF